MMSVYQSRGGKDRNHVVGMILLLAVLSLTADPTSLIGVNGFQPTTLSSRTVKRTQPMPGFLVSRTTEHPSLVSLSAFNDNLREDDNSRSNTDDDDGNKIRTFLSSPIVKQIMEINNKFWDYTCNFLYVAISCLILLNLTGFGYTLSMENGLDVMPVDKYRTERQWREQIAREEAAAAQYQQQQASSYRPTTILQQHGALLDASVDSADVSS